MCDNYDDINLIPSDYAGKWTPVIEIESDEVSTAEHNQIKEVEDINAILPHYDSNWSHCILERPKFVDDYYLLLLVKVNDFRKFLDEKQTIEIKKINFYLQRFNRSLSVTVKIIPGDENFSVQIEFKEEFNTSNTKTEERIGTNISRKQDDLESFCLLDNDQIDDNGLLNYSRNKNDLDSKNYLEEMFTKDFQEILSKNEIILDFTMGIYTTAKKYFTRNKKEKLKLNVKNQVYIDDFYPYDRLLYEKLVDPFTFRIKILTAGKISEKCEDSIGISNEGNTCYMNSIIQSFFHIKQLRKAIFKIPSAEDSPIYGIQKVFYNLMNEKNSLKLPQLFKSLEWEKSFWNSQQDAQEIFSIIFNIISEQEKLVLGESQLSNLCEGIVNSKVSCTDIVFESTKQESFMFLQLDLENSSNLIECIEKFISVESLLGENRYELHDKTKHEATRSFMFSKIPEILFVQLKRFKCDGADIIKVCQRIEYPQQLNLADYYSSKVDELIYSLYAVIVHDGSMHSGHYFIFLRDFKKGKWVKFNDTKVTYADDSEVFLQNFGGSEDTYQITDDGEIIKIETDIVRTAYILIYVQKEKKDFLFQDLKNSDIPESLVEMLTSNRRYKPTQATINNKKIESFYPNINNFLKNNTDQNVIPKLDKNYYNNINEIGNNRNHNINSKLFPTKSSTGKIKHQDRNSSQGRLSSKDKTNNGSKTAKNQNDRTQQIINHIPRTIHDEFIIDLGDLSGNHSNFKTTLSSKSHQVGTKDSSLNNIKSFISKYENLTRGFTFSFIDNKTNKRVEKIKLDKSLDKKITAMGFIEECHRKLKSTELELHSIKLMVLNNMGLLIRIVDDSEEISDLLLNYHKKNIYLCFYILEDDTVISLSHGQIICVQVMTLGFESRNEIVDIHKNGHLIKPPIIIKEEKMMNNEQEFKRCVINCLKEIHGDGLLNKESKNEIKFRLIENTQHKLSEIVNNTQIKLTKGFGQYEFMVMTKKEIIPDRFIRLAVELL